MNESFEQPNEQPMNDGSALPIEQQLQSFRPRAPRVDWQAVAPQATPTVLPGQPRTGFTYRQLSLAMAASWLVGAVVGGGCIFWSMSTRENLRLNPDVAQATVESPKPSHGDASIIASNGVQRDPVVASQTSETAAAFTIIDADWLSDEPLGVRSMTSAKPARLTALRPPSATDALTTKPDEPRSQTFESAPVSNRQQLMQKYLQQTDQQVY